MVRLEWFVDYGYCSLMIMMMMMMMMMMMIIIILLIRDCRIGDCTTGDCRICENEIEKIEKYQNLKRELKRLWLLKKVEVVPAVVGVLGSTSKGSSGWMDTLGIKLNVGMVQRSVLLGKARILRKV